MAGALCAGVGGVGACAQRAAQSAQNAPVPVAGDVSLRGDISLRGRVEAMIAEPAVARAHWGISVTRMDGTPVLAVNEGQFFQPASNAKLFTTAAVMALLPVGERLHTTVIASGEWKPGGVLRGDLILLGAGDANFSGRPVPYRRPVPGKPEPPRDELRFAEEMAEQVKAAGLTRIEGRIFGDDGLFEFDPYPADWAIDDAPWYYGAPVNALMIADNAITVTVTPGKRKVQGSGLGTVADFEMPTVTLDPALPYYTVDVQGFTSPDQRSQSVTIRRSIGSKTLYVDAGMNPGGPPYVQAISIEDPAEYAAMALKAALERRGIPVTGTAEARHGSPAGDWKPDEHPENFSYEFKPAKQLFDFGGFGLKSCGEAKEIVPGEALCVAAQHMGPALYEDVVITNKVSQNQHAEVLLRRLGLDSGYAGTTAAGAHVLTLFLMHEAGIDPQDFMFYDGSGLSGHDLVTPRAVTQLLRYGAAQPWGAGWKASLPVGGEDGSLRARFAEAPLKGHVFAKTGTLGEARALSGYLDCASGQTVVFSVMVSAHTPLNQEDERVMDRIVAAIAAAE